MQSNPIRRPPSVPGRLTTLIFPFRTLKNDVRWHADSKHMTEEGYAQLGRALAPKVKEILEGM